MDVHIHPLVVMSLADHYTREKLQNKKDRAIGLLFGKQKGQVVTIFESFELANLDAKTLEEFEKNELEIFKQIYPDYECVGWYSTGDKVRDGDKKMHQSVTKTVEEEKEGAADWRSERPLYVLLDPAPKEDQRDLPLQVFEEAVKILDNKKTTEFVKSVFRLTSDEAERVTVVHCARVITGDEGKEQSAVTTPYTTLKKAITSLNERLRILHKFLEDVQKGKVKADQKTLRRIKALCQRLPTMDTPSFRDDFFSEYNDALLVTYLASITKSQSSLNSLVENFNMTAGGAAMSMMGMGGGRSRGGMMSSAFLGAS
jgi:COP9 signalosome complex subunit 6